MLKMKNKDLIMIGLIIGIAFFFIGAMINNVFPSSEADVLSFKVSAAIKLIGLGFVTSSMVIGGIIIEDIDKNLKMLLLILGLVLLIIYTFGAQELQWEASISGMASESDAYDSMPDAYGTPGFEMIYGLLALCATILIIRYTHNR